MTKSLVWAVLAVATTVAAAPALSQAGAGPGSHIQFVHGAGTTPGDTPMAVYAAPAGSDEYGLFIIGGQSTITYGQTWDLGLLPAGTWSVLLCSEPGLEVVDACPGDTLIAGPDEVTVPDGGETVWVAGWVSPPDEIDVSSFTLDTGCTPAGSARATFAHAAAMDELLVFVDGARNGRPPIARGEQVASPVVAGDHQVDFLTLGTEFFVLPVPSVAFPAATNTFVVAVGPGDPNPEDPEITDLRAVTVDVGVETCPEPTTTTTTAPPPPSAPPQDLPPAFTG